jgi:nicotinamide-nucleotide amidase
MPVAEIIAIGTELLLGEIQDTNTQFLARAFRDAGIDLYRSTVIGDNTDRIARTIQESINRADIVITTGGLGPTVDDPTRQAVAIALGVQTEYRPELWEQIKARFQRFNRQATENNKRQAFIPAGSIPVENPVGTAPAFFSECAEKVIISLPGVPREMEFLVENKVLPYLREKYHLSGTIKAHNIHTAGAGESQIDELIGDLEKLSNPTVGLLAHAGQIDIRVTAKANSFDEAETMMAPIIARIYERVGEHIYGMDDLSLENAVQKKLQENNAVLNINEQGLEGMLANRLQHAGIEFYYPPKNGWDTTKIVNNIGDDISSKKQHIQLTAIFTPGTERQNLDLRILSDGKLYETNRSYGGPPLMGRTWAINTALDYLRRML